MIYLHRYTTNANGNPTVEIAACETEATAQTCEARGFERVPCEVFCVAWRLRDTRRLMAMRAGVPQPLRARAVGESAPIGGRKPTPPAVAIDEPRTIKIGGF